MSEWQKTPIGFIPATWDYLPFDSILIGSTRNGIYKQKKFHGKGVKVVNMGEIFANDRIGNIPMSRIELTDKELDLTGLKKGDLLFARRSLTAEGAGKCSILLDQNEPLTFESSIIRARPDNIKVDSRYLYYLFNSRIGKYLLRSILRQVAVAGITGEDLKNLNLPLPTVQEQVSIANALESLDLQIENLQRQNQTLEKIAQTLFKQWFVDFNSPNENGKPYKDNGGEMVESELGLIPKGWSIGVLGRVADVGSSKRIFLSEYINEGVPFYRSKEIIELRSGKAVSTELFISVEKFNEIKKKFGAPIENDILLTSVGTIGIPYLVKKDDNFYFKDGNLTWIKNFKEGFNGIFIFYWLLSKSVQHQIKSNTIGSTQKALTIDALKNLNFLVPLPQILKDFSDILDALNKKIEKNTNQIQTLSKTRDTLLPKLMSGKIRVGE